MRQMLAVALMGMGLAFTASAAMAGESELPLRLQQQAAVMVGTESGSATVAAMEPRIWPIWHEHDRGR